MNWCQLKDRNKQSIYIFNNKITYGNPNIRNIPISEVHGFDKKQPQPGHHEGRSSSSTTLPKQTNK